MARKPGSCVWCCLPIRSPSAANSLLMLHGICLCWILRNAMSYQVVCLIGYGKGTDPGSLALVYPISSTIYVLSTFYGSVFDQPPMFTDVCGAWRAWLAADQRCAANSRFMTTKQPCEDNNEEIDVGFCCVKWSPEQKHISIHIQGLGGSHGQHGR